MTDLLQSPPVWILAIMIAIMTAHALDKLVTVVTRKESHNAIIPILELFIVFVLGFLVLHSYYENILTAEQHAEWYDHPITLVIALVFFGLASLGLYVGSQALHSARPQVYPKKKRK